VQLVTEQQTEAAVVEDTIDVHLNNSPVQAVKA
jgi:hypothetical protein